MIARSSKVFGAFVLLKRGDVEERWITRVSNDNATVCCMMQWISTAVGLTGCHISPVEMHEFALDIVVERLCDAIVCVGRMLGMKRIRRPSRFGVRRSELQTTR